MCENSVVFESRLFCVSCLLRRQCCQVAEILAKMDKKWADNRSVLEEFKAEFYQK
jgi:hypothetical protein